VSARLPPPLLGARPLGALPVPDSPVGDDPILGAYDQPRPAAAEAPGLPIGPDEVAAFLVGLGDLLARVRGPHWHIEPDETAMVAPAIARQLSKDDNALGAWIVAHGDALVITLGAALIVTPRAMTEYQVIRFRRRQLEAELEAAKEQERYGGLARAAGRPSDDGAGAGLPGDRGEGAAAGDAGSQDNAATLRALTGR